MLGSRAAAVTIRLASVPERELDGAAAFCRERGIPQTVIALDQFRVPGFAENPPDRCYLCKRRLFLALKAYAEKEGLAAVMDGTNLDDAGSYRPGLRAIEELGVRSPLREAGMTKADIRALAKRAGLSVWSKPAFACLATRFPYGERITEEKLRMAEAAEDFLWKEGFIQSRVRMHGDLARIEVPEDDLPRLFAMRKKRRKRSGASDLPMWPWISWDTAWEAWMRRGPGKGGIMEIRDILEGIRQGTLSVEEGEAWFLEKKKRRRTGRWATRSSIRAERRGPASRRSFSAAGSPMPTWRLFIKTVRNGRRGLRHAGDGASV